MRGCYPGGLLKAWDKFDQEKGSDNDRPGKTVFPNLTNINFEPVSNYMAT